MRMVIVDLDIRVACRPVTKYMTVLRSEAGGRKNENLSTKIDCNVEELFLGLCASVLFGSPDLLGSILTVTSWNAEIYYRFQINLSHQFKSRQLACLLASCISLVLAHKTRLLQ